MTVETLLHSAAAAFGVSYDDLLRDYRTSRIVGARRAIAYILREDYGWAYARIARTIGGSHSIWLERHRIARDVNWKDEDFRARVEKIREALR